MENLYEKLKGMRFQQYKNSTPICTISGVPLTVEDAIKAAIISRLNVLLIGERGEGKTLIENDALDSYFGGDGNHIRASPDLDLKNLYQRLNLHKLKEAETTDEVKEITSKIAKPITIVDEINRAPPIIQNQIFNVCDGYVEIEGTRYDLGKQGYSIGIASANTGGRYSGIFEMDTALLDRFHLILDIDNFPPTVKDSLEIIIDSSDPRIKSGEKIDHTKDIIEIHNSIKDKKLPLNVLIADLFLKHGLDYCNNAPYSKNKLKEAFPAICESCHEAGSYCGMTIPVSTRATKSLKALVLGLEAVAESKGAKQESSLDNFFEAFKLIAPYSGILSPIKVQQLYHGNGYLAINAIVDSMKKEFSEKKDLITEGLSRAQKGKLDGRILDTFSGKWGFYGDILKDINEKAQGKKSSEDKEAK